MRGITAELLGYALQKRQLEEAARTGVEALVRGYYDEYTDADELDPAFVRNLQSILEHAGYDWDEDGLQSIRRAEEYLNSMGGVLSDTEIRRHLVHTPEAWADDE